jgi:hypothetical protein
MQPQPIPKAPNPAPAHDEIGGRRRDKFASERGFTREQVERLLRAAEQRKKSL